MTYVNPRLRGKGNNYSGPWPLGSIPDSVLYGIGKQLVHRLAVGHADITGDDFGTIFANAVDGEHRESPLGIADVVSEGTAWTVKTVKAKRPRTQRKVRLISGRNSPDYSLGISDPRKDPSATGAAVLAIWNSRVNESLDHYNELRTVVFIRNMGEKVFCLFEQPTVLFPAEEYRWEFNKQGNLEGYEKQKGAHSFTWQPHGSQFTIIKPVPGSARYFQIDKNVPIVPEAHVMRIIQYQEDWIKIG